MALHEKVGQLVRLLAQNDDSGKDAFFRQAFFEAATVKELDLTNLAELVGNEISEQALVESLCTSMSEEFLLQHFRVLVEGCADSAHDDTPQGNTTEDVPGDSYDISFEVRLPDYTVGRAPSFCATPNEPSHVPLLVVRVFFLVGRRKARKQQTAQPRRRFFLSRMST